jgi:hypothetical protein
MRRRLRHSIRVLIRPHIPMDATAPQRLSGIKSLSVRGSVLIRAIRVIRGRSLSSFPLPHSAVLHSAASPSPSTTYGIQKYLSEPIDTTWTLVYDLARTPKVSPSRVGTGRSTKEGRPPKDTAGPATRKHRRVATGRSPQAGRPPNNTGGLALRVGAAGPATRRTAKIHNCPH